MKAAILNNYGDTPTYQDINEPKAPNSDQLILEVKAAALKNFDKIMATGKSYVNYGELPSVVGTDAVGCLADGRRVYAQARGTMAHKILIDKNKFIELPENISWASAAALPNAVLGSALALLKRAKIKKGDVVLIHGGTGVTGKIACQLAKHYGASKVFVTGHTEKIEAQQSELGIDALISTRMSDGEFIEELHRLNESNPITIVLDYLWGHTAELILKFLMGKDGKFMDQFTRFIQIGSLSGDEITVNANWLRSSKVEIIGSGVGSHTAEDFQEFFTTILPEAFKLAAENKLTIDTTLGKLEDIESLWTTKTSGSRLVIQL
ncbi:MAG TPA: zinc-binding alcohol dehydrogenase family protein [Candidatus Sphingobacterium stercoripullorum]|nr:zinc-binding alcohol dehydrogenase family protein [Candidatus Sphingobacterium stercoripullorum]